MKVIFDKENNMRIINCEEVNTDFDLHGILGKYLPIELNSKIILPLYNKPRTVAGHSRNIIQTFENNADNYTQHKILIEN